MAGVFTSSAEVQVEQEKVDRNVLNLIFNVFEVTIII